MSKKIKSHSLFSPAFSTCVAVIAVLSAIFAPFVIQHYRVLNTIEFGGSSWFSSVTGNQATHVTTLPASIDVITEDWGFHGFDYVQQLGLSDRKIPPNFFWDVSQLENLWLHRCQIDSKSMSVLLSSPNLKRVELSGPDVLVAFGKVDKTSLAIQSLELSGQSINENHVVGIDDLNQLFELHIFSQEAVSQAVIERAAQSPTLNTFMLSIGNGNDCSIAPLRHSKSITSLFVVNSDGDSENFFDRIHCCRPLRELSIWQTSVSKNGFHEIAKCSGLVSLSLRNTDVEFEDFKILGDGQLQNLSQLEVCNKASLSIEGLAHLIERLPSLNTVYLDRRNIDKPLLEELKMKFPAVRFSME